MSTPPMERTGWQSVRTILEALILAALVWCGRTLILTGESMARMSVQLETLTAQMQGMPELGTRVTKLELRVEQHGADIQELRRLRDVR